jgi:uncharacterized protein (UPF0261 family)
LFDGIAQGFRPGGNRKLLRFTNHINDPAFAEALVANFNEITKTAWPASLARTS